MKREIKTIDELQQYLLGVKGRADHHGQSVNAIVFLIAGAVIQYKDPGAPIVVLMQNDELKNAMWVSIGGENYVFTFDHDNGAVQMKEGSTHGPVVKRFDNGTRVEEAIEFFDQLAVHKVTP